MKVAALDLGSNTFLCLICDVTQGQIGQVYADEVQVVRLGQGLSASKKFHPEALQRAQKTLTEFATLIQKHKPEKVLAMATSAARDAENKDELFKICQDLNIPLQIISGDQEAQITYSGSTSGMDKRNNYLVIDIGGGSTEFIVGHGHQMMGGHSQNIGCVRFTERFITTQPTPSIEVQSCRQEIQKVLKDSRQKINLPENFQILAVAGTPTALVAAELGKFDEKKIDGYRLTQDKIDEWLQKLVPASVEEKLQMGIPAGRADVILVGVLILLSSLEVFNKNEMTVSTRGVRYGIALNMCS